MIFRMGQILNVNTVSDYANYIGAPVVHPLISVIHYDELASCRHSLNNYEVYGLFLMEEIPQPISYGQGVYKVQPHSLLSVAPGQTGGVSDVGEVISLKGWALLFSPQLISGNALGKKIESYHYFSYYRNEALVLENAEWSILVKCFKLLRYELYNFSNTPLQLEILSSYLQLILDYCARFYQRQFQDDIVTDNKDLLKRFDKLLREYYRLNLQKKYGIPTVKYCARELFLSPNYFGDLIRRLTGRTAIAVIRQFIMQRAKNILLEGKTISETAKLLGFEYPQHFTRQFKKQYDISPTQWLLDNDNTTNGRKISNS